MKHMVDKSGNRLTKIGHYWMSDNFDRFWQLITEHPDKYIILSSGSNGKVYSKTKAFIARSRLAAAKKFQEREWRFLDPETQIAYPER